MRRLWPVLLLAGAACDFALPRTLTPGELSGRVVVQDADGTRRVLPGTRVSVEGAPLSALAGHDGRFSLRGVPAG